MHRTFSACFLLIALIAIPFSLHAADGDLDPSFGSDGKVTTDFDGGVDAGLAMTTDELGRILVAGHAEWNNHLNMAVLRCKRDGSLDPGP